ncbi:phage protein, HK97 gp10 family [Enterococcus faecalis 13-SD-W-01]|nr:phage protein, HK97 gp10 family [Enterococcus faecalis 13-SD-W-01]
MSKTVKFVGVDKFTRGITQQSVKMEKAVSQEVQRSILRVEKKAKQLAPWDSGFLSNSIYSMMTSVLIGEIKSPADYSIYVEEGTRRMAAQPFLFPAVKMEYAVFMKNLNKIVRG